MAYDFDSLCEYNIKYKEFNIMDNLIETLRKQFDFDKNVSDEEIMECYNRGLEEHNKGVNEIVDSYEKLDMDKFIERIGGQQTVDAMHKINEKLDRSELVNGKLVEKKTPKHSYNENIEEWKKGFMEGFEEAYKRLKG